MKIIGHDRRKHKKCFKKFVRASEGVKDAPRYKKIIKAINKNNIRFYIEGSTIRCVSSEFTILNIEIFIYNIYVLDQ